MIFALQATQGGSSWTYMHVPTSSMVTSVLAGLTVTMDVDNVDSCEFSIYPSHPLFNSLGAMKSLVAVVEVLDDFAWNTGTMTPYQMLRSTWDGSNAYYGKTRLLFWGRIISMNFRMDERGMHYAECVCEGAEGFLNDTHWRLDMTGGSDSILSTLISEGNTTYRDGSVKVTLSRGFAAVRDRNNAFTNQGVLLGRRVDAVNVLDRTGTAVWLMPESGASVREIARDMVEQVASELQVVPTNPETPGSGLTINVKSRIVSGTTDSITLGGNMLSCVKSMDCSEMINYLTPVGDLYNKKVTYNGHAWEHAPHHILLSDFISQNGAQAEAVMTEYAASHGFELSVPNRSIFNRSNISTYGLHAATLDISGLGTVKDGVVSTGAAATTKVMRYACMILAEHMSPKFTYEVKAVNWSLLGTKTSAKDILPYRWFSVTNLHAKINDTLECKSVRIHEEDRTQDTFTFGTKRKKSTQLNTGHGEKFRISRKSSGQSIVGGGGIKSDYGTKNWAKNFVSTNFSYADTTRTLTIGDFN